MRAVFTIDLPERDGGYPSDEDIVNVLRRFGWELQRMEQLTSDDIRAIMGTQRRSNPQAHASELEPSNEIVAGAVPVRSVASATATDLGAVATAAAGSNVPHYKRLAAELFRDMPEVAAAERQAVIFAGYLSAEQVLFVITRMVPAQVTFRLLHREFPKLRAATEKMMAKVVSARLNNEPVHVVNPSVYIYERGYDHVIIKGRVITQPLRETIRSNLKDTILFIVPLVLFVPTVVVSLYYPEVADTSATF